MAIENVTGGVQSYSLLEGGETTSVNSNSQLANLPSYLSASDLNFSSSVTGVLGIRLPMTSAAQSTELLLAFLENEAYLRGNRSVASHSLIAQASDLRPSEEDAQKVSDFRGTIDDINAMIAAARALLGLEDDTENNIENATYNKYEAFQAVSASLLSEIGELDSQIANLDQQILALDPEISNYDNQLKLLTDQRDAAIADKIPFSQQLQQAKAQIKQDLELGSPVFGPLQQKWNELSDSIKGIQKNIEDKNADIENAQSQINLLEDGIINTEVAIDATKQEIEAIQKKIDDGDKDKNLQTQLDAANLKLSNYEADLANLKTDKLNAETNKQNLEAEKSALVQKLAEKSSEFNEVDKSFSEVKNSISAMVNASDLIQQQEVLLIEASNEVISKETQITGLATQQRAANAAATEEDLKSAEKLFEIMKQLVKGDMQVFWNESNRERIMKTERRNEDPENGEENVDQFAAYTVSRSMPGEVISNPNAVENRDLDKISADRVYDETKDFISDMANVLKAVEELRDQPKTERDLRHGKVMLSLT